MAERKQRNVLSLPDQLKVIEWLRENWDRRVIRDQMYAPEITDAIANEKGIEKIVTRNVLSIIKQVFPQWRLPRGRHEQPMATNGSNEFKQAIEDLHAKIDLLTGRVKHIEESFGIS